MRSIEDDHLGGGTMKTVANTTFKVTEVERASQPLTEQPYKEAVETLLTAGIPRHQREVVDGAA